MDILIKGMDMPKDMSNPLHISIFSNGSVWITHEGKTEATAQELLPHGELIQRDNLLDFIEQNEDVNVGTIYDVIQDAPTVLEASKETE